MLVTIKKPDSHLMTLMSKQRVQRGYSFSSYENKLYNQHQSLSDAPFIQPKLIIGEVDDPYEREAVLVAEAITRMPDSITSLNQDSSHSLKRKAVNKMTLDGTLPSVRETLHTPGQPLDVGTRAYMEPRFGYDFSKVRIHADSKAAESARAINARAYTVGNDVVFGIGQYKPTTDDGMSLIGHEMTHVVQQNIFPQTSNSIQRFTDFNFGVLPPNWKPGTPFTGPQRIWEETTLPDETVPATGTTAPENVGETPAPAEKTETETESELTENQPSGKVCLTFDDGPNEGTKVVLKALGDIPATFFFIGKNVEKYQTLVSEIIQANKHQIGTHTYAHSPLTVSQYRTEFGPIVDKKKAAEKKKKDLENQLEGTTEGSEQYQNLSSQIKEAEAQIAEADKELKKALKPWIEKGEAPVQALMEEDTELLFRPPGGAAMGTSLHREIMAAIAGMGKTAVMWEYELGRPKGTRNLKCQWVIPNVFTECVGENIPMKGPKAGDRVLFHDHDWPGHLDLLKSVFSTLSTTFKFTFGKLNKDGKCV